MNSHQKKAAAKKRNDRIRSNPEFTFEEEIALKYVLGWCQRCGSNTEITLDHIKPISKGGKNSLDNIQVLCYTCNSKKANKELPSSIPSFLLPSQEDRLRTLPLELRKRIGEVLKCKI